MTAEHPEVPAVSGSDVALVTGAGSGIGAAIACRLAADGLRIAVVDLDPEGAADTAAAIERAGGTATAVVADIGGTEAPARVVDQVGAQVGEVTVLVNNAAHHGQRHGVLELGAEEWNRVISVNVSAAMFLAQAVAGPMSAKGSGCIVNVGAIQAELPVPSYAAYVTSKGGVASLTKALASELSPSGIRVNSVVPGAIGTGTMRAAVASVTPEPTVPTLLGRMGTAEEVAAAVSFLVGPDASFITGAELVVDGGRRLSRAADPFEQFRLAGSQPAR